MKPELDKQLCDKFPILYRDRGASMQETCMCWGFPGSGWFNLIHDLSQKLEIIAASQPDNEHRLKATQVKEKFGTLRFYTNYSSPEIDNAIREAEKLSAITCEQCGEPGSVRRGGWVVTMCDKCYEEYQKKRNG